MKLAVEFPSVAYREGGAAVTRLAQEIERIGYDQLDMFDHVVMGFATDTRPAPIYPPQMPLLEALTTLAYVAAGTSRIGLGTEVLVLPQRQPVLVAKQVSTLDTLSGGRVRLGVGVGWQQAEFDALGEAFGNRGARMDEAIHLLRACWGEDHIDFDGEHYRADAIAMEPKPPQQARLPVWVGGGSQRALRRVGELGDGWLAPAMTDDGRVRSACSEIRRAAESAGRNPDAIGLQMMLDVPPRDAEGKAFYTDLDRVVARAEQVASFGFGWGTLNATAIFQAGHRSVDAIVEVLGKVHDRVRAAVGH